MTPYEWMDLPENRDHNGNIDASAAMAVRKDYGWSQKEVQEAAEEHRAESNMRMQSTFVAGTYDMLYIAHRWGNTPEYIAGVLGRGMTEQSFCGWLDKWDLPVPDGEYTDSDTVTRHMAEYYPGHPGETCWEYAELPIPDEYKRPA